MAFRRYRNRVFLIWSLLSSTQSYAQAKSVLVPILVGLDIKDPMLSAKNLKEGNFHLQVKRHEKSRTVTKGKIISQEPRPGTMAKKNSTITVVVSEGS